MRRVVLRRIGMAAAAALAFRAGAVAPESDFEFGTVRPGADVVHDFVLRNEASVDARISAVRLSAPLRLERTPATIPAGGEVRLRVRLDTSRLRGDFRGRVVIALEGAPEREFVVAGRVEPAIEILPLPAVFLATSRGKAKSAAVEIVQRDAAPLEVAIAKQPAEGEARLETIEPGRRYRLTVSIGADALPGRRGDRVELATSSPAHSWLPVAVSILVRERVHVFPEAVDLGTLRLRDLRAAGPAPNALSQTVMVYQEGGTNFRVDASTSVGALAIAAEPGPRHDRVQLTVSLRAGNVKAGPIEGAVDLATNDPQFPRVSIPVTGVVLPD